MADKTGADGDEDRTAASQPAPLLPAGPVLPDGLGAPGRLQPASGVSRAELRASALAHASPDPRPGVAPAAASPTVTLAVVAFCLLLTLSAYAGPSILGLAVALAGMVVAWGWAGLLALPSPLGTAAVIAVGTASSVVATVSTRGEPYLRWMPAALAVSLAGAFAHQLARRDGRPRLVESIAGATTGLAVVTGGAALVPLPAVHRGADAVLVALTAVALAALVELAWRGSARGTRLHRTAPAVGVALGLGASIAMGSVVGLPGLTSALLGGCCAGISSLARLVLAPLPTMSGRRSQLVCGTSSVLICGVVVYLLDRVLVG